MPTFKRFAPDVRVPRTGRIKFGTRNRTAALRTFTISNVTFDGCRSLALETVDGGLLEGVTISNITMRDIITAPIFLRLGRRMRGPDGVPIGVLRRLIINGIVCSNSASRISSIISGIPGHPIEDVKISNIYVQHQGGGTRETAAIDPPENENAYPEPTMFGAMPSHGLYIRHARNIEVSDIEIAPMKEDFRPAFALNDVQGASFSHVKIPHTAGVPSFVLKNVLDFSVDHRSKAPARHANRPRPDQRRFR